MQEAENNASVVAIEDSKDKMHVLIQIVYLTYQTFFNPLDIRTPSPLTQNRSQDPVKNR